MGEFCEIFLQITHTIHVWICKLPISGESNKTNVWVNSRRHRWIVWRFRCPLEAVEIPFCSGNPGNDVDHTHVREAQPQNSGGFFW